jgi:hypothetical protein
MREIVFNADGTVAEIIGEPDPVEPAPPPDPTEVLAGIAGATAAITGSSTMAQVRTALIAVHAASSAATPGP